MQFNNSLQKQITLIVGSLDPQRLLLFVHCPIDPPPKKKKIKLLCVVIDKQLSRITL
jgi:hypothetical protein